MAKEKDKTKKAHTVWLRARQQEMLDQMPGVSVADIARQAVEDLFQGRNDREYARIVVEDDLNELMAQWEKMLGMTSSATVTATEDGFRIVVVALKQFSDAQES